MRRCHDRQSGVWQSLDHRPRAEFAAGRNCQRAEPGGKRAGSSPPPLSDRGMERGNEWAAGVPKAPHLVHPGIPRKHGVSDPDPTMGNPLGVGPQPSRLFPKKTVPSPIFFQFFLTTVFIRDNFFPRGFIAVRV